MKDEPQFRATAAMLVESAKMIKLLNSRRGAQDVERLVAAFVETTVALVDRLEAENARLRGDTTNQDVPLV